jgi:hypothetical protein
MPGNGHVRFGGGPRGKGLATRQVPRRVAYPAGLLTVYNALIDQAVAAAVDLDVDPDEISFVAVLRATRDHFAPTTPCANCGHHPVRDPGNLTAAITAAPRNRTGRRRTSPRSTKNRRTQHTRNVVYTIDVVETNLPTLVQVA